LKSTVISPETVRRFLDAGRPVTAEWFNKFSALKMFFRFVLSRGYATRNPLPLSHPKNPRQFRPYLYSMEEVQKMIRVVDIRHRGKWHLEPCTIRTLILLLYGTGLGMGEAIRLQHRDVDLNDAILTVRETKFYNTRLVPVSSDLTGVLRAYFERKWKEHGTSTSTSFLATYDGRPVTRLTAERNLSRNTQRSYRDTLCLLLPRLALQLALVYTKTVCPYAHPRRAPHTSLRHISAKA
jgi:site-specific recombinase XerD